LGEETQSTEATTKRGEGFRGGSHKGEIQSLSVEGKGTCFHPKKAYGLRDCKKKYLHRGRGGRQGKKGGGSITKEDK